MVNNIHEIKCGRTIRNSFARTKDVVDFPYLIELQRSSYKKFLSEGIRETFDEFSPIVHRATNGQERFALEFGEFAFDQPQRTAIECKSSYFTTYSAALRVKVRLTLFEKGGEIKEAEIFMGDFPLMTDTGSFIVNGAERVVVSQLVRSPGVYCEPLVDKKSGEAGFKTTVIPKNGAWIEFEYEAGSNMFYVHVDRKKKISTSILLRALEITTDEELISVFGEDALLLSTMAKDKDQEKTLFGARTELYKNIKNGDIITEAGISANIPGIFYDKKRYDLSRVGRYKYNKKLSLATRIYGKELAEDIVDPETGEVLAEKGAVLTREQAWAVQNAGVNVAYITYMGEVIKIIGNNTVEIASFIDADFKSLGILEKMVHYPTLMSVWEGLDTYEEKVEALRANATRLVSRQICRDDIISIVNYTLNLRHGVGECDNIDHLANRRVRAVGELLQHEIRKGFQKMETLILDKMNTTTNAEDAEIKKFINVKPVTSKVKEFFNSAQLSQFMDQQNPIAELTHKRKLSALGPGGLNRERAGTEVRDVNHSHYGRLCPIETPEGQNIGLISSLAAYSRVNEYGFIETPYRKVVNGCATDIVEFLTADVEDEFNVCQAIEPMDENGKLLNHNIACRCREDIKNVSRDEVNYMDVSPKQLVSVATSLIPFLENDDTNRALMGSNMQRQAVPLLKPEAPWVGTGMEYYVARDSGIVVLAENDGVAEYVTADKIIIKENDGNERIYPLQKFQRSNHDTCINQKPIVKKGDKVKKGEAIADGPATDNGELALGRNIRIGFMSWEGYNYEDAILISEELVREDVFTSIHIQSHETEARSTRLGDEEITRDIPNRSDDMLKNLDEDGIIMIGSEVRAGDILVGKVAPKGETEATPEERLLRSIFGDKARDVRDVSLTVPHGDYGVVVDVKIFTKENKPDLSPGVNKLVKIFIAQKRKISVGDKMAGRHGNKGVVSRVLPKADMPFMKDGRSLQIVLNPLGVPSRMNIGQVLEVHLGYVCSLLGWHIATPVFDGAKEDQIKELLVQNGLPADGKEVLFDGRTGEEFENRVTVGTMYMLKLIHLVDDKIHARSTGSYSLVTQQPLGGKAKFGGQRLGEMEVWAIEAYGAANLLQEMLTVKSDDLTGREKTYQSITKGENISEPGIPESFRVLVREMRSLMLDIRALNEHNEEISDNMMEETVENNMERSKDASEELTIFDTKPHEMEEEEKSIFDLVHGEDDNGMDTDDDDDGGMFFGNDFVDDDDEDVDDDDNN